MGAEHSPSFLAHGLQPLLGLEGQNVSKKEDTYLSHEAILGVPELLLYQVSIMQCEEISDTRAARCLVLYNSGRPASARSNATG